MKRILILILLMLPVTAAAVDYVPWYSKDAVTPTTSSKLLTDDGTTDGTVTVANLLALATKSDVGLALVENILHNFGSSTTPNAGTDSADGYSIGSIWTTTSGRFFICTSAVTGAATWAEVVTDTNLTHTAGDISFTPAGNLEATLVSTALAELDSEKEAALTCDEGQIKQYLSNVWACADYSTGGSGETNTASNIGTAGVGLYDQKVGADLQFRKINAGSVKVAVTDDPTNNEVDIDIVPSQIHDTDLASFDYSDLTGTPTIPSTLADMTDDSTHRTVTDTEKTSWGTAYTHSQATTGNPHSVAKADVGLTNVTDDAQLKRAGSDWSLFTELNPPANSDWVLVELGSTGAKRKLQIGNLPSVDGGSLTVEEVDESPSGVPDTLKFTNGAVTDNGDGSYTVDFSLSGHDHSGTYEPADATILKDADIGSTVQAYSANMDTDSTDDFSGAYGDLTGAPPTITTEQADAITANSNHVADVTTNPHSVTATNVGLGSVLNSEQVEVTDIGTTVQAYDADLDTLAAVTVTAAGTALLDDADAAAQRTTLGLGTSAAKNTGTTAGTIPLFSGLCSGGSSTGSETTEAECTLASGTWTVQFPVSFNIADMADYATFAASKQDADANLPTWPSTVDATEVGYLDGVTSGIQAQINALSGGTGGFNGNTLIVDGGTISSSGYYEYKSDIDMSTGVDIASGVKFFSVLATGNGAVRLDPPSGSAFVSNAGVAYTDNYYIKTAGSSTGWEYLEARITDDGDYWLFREGATIASTGAASTPSSVLWEPTFGGTPSYSTDAAYDTKLLGQTITGLATGDEITSIDVYIATVFGSGGNLSLRIGTTADLSGESSVVEAVTTADNDSWVTFTLPAGVTGSTSYYVGLMGPAAYANRVGIYYAAATESGRYSSACAPVTTWDMTGCTASGSDSHAIKLNGTAAP